jgi:predicted O-methyltransferase YrrM
MTNTDSALFAVSTARKLAVQGHGAKFQDIPEATAQYYHFLYFLARIWQSRVIVELGVYKGHSLAHLARGNPAATVVGVDRTLEHVNRRILPANVRLVEQDSVTFLRQWPSINPERINLLHIDTEHVVEQASSELEEALAVMDRPGIICIDDVFASPEMQQWWYRLPQTKVVCIELHATGYGVIVV